MKTRSNQTWTARFTGLAVAAAIILAFAGEARAGTATWDGGGGSSSWSAGLNWDPDGFAAFDNTCDITFNAVGAARLSNFLGANRTIRSLTFNADADSAVTIRTTTLAANTVAASPFFEADSGDATINVDADSTGNHTIGIVGTSGQIVLVDNLVINHDGSGTLTFGRRLNQGGNISSVTKNGTGKIIFANDTSSLNNYASFIMNAGTVENNSQYGFGDATAANTITFNGGTILCSVAIANNAVVENTGNLKTWQYGGTGNTTYSGNFTLNETTAGNFRIEITGSGNLFLDGLISGAGDIEKTGTGGFLRLGQLGANTFTGNTKVTAGELRLNNLGAIQNSPLDMAGSGFITANAGAGNYVIGGLISGRDLASVITGNPANVTTLTLNPQSGTVTYNDVIGDLSTGMAVIKSGAGTQVLGGGSTYTGTTTVNGGTLQLGDGATGGSLNTSSAIDLAAGTFAVNQTDTVTQGTEFSGAAITGAAGGFTQLGPGTTILNVANSYAGPTAVSNGTLIVNGDQSAATGAITVGGANASGTPTLGGTGTLGGNVTIATAGGGAAGTLAPGDGGIGNLILNSTALTLQSGSTASFDVNADALTRDRVTGISTLTYGGTLKITVTTGTLGIGDSWDLFDFSSQSGTFDNGFPAAGDDIDLPALTGMLWQLDYSSGTLSIIADAGKPTVTITQAAGQLDPTNSSPINFAVVFSEDVTGFTDSDVDLTGSTAPGTLAAAVTGGPATYNVAVSGMTGDGDVVIAIPEDAVDAPGNVASDPGIGDDTVAYDPTAPTLASGAIADDQGGGPVDLNTTITYTLTFSEDIDEATFSVENPGSATIDYSNLTWTALGTYTVEVTPTTTGELTLRVPATVKDPAGNSLASAPVDDAAPITVQLPTYVWQSDSSANWNVDDARWDTGTFPNGADTLADFSQLDITANRTITLGQNITVGNMTVGDTDNSNFYTFTGNTLTFNTTGGATLTSVSDIDANNFLSIVTLGSDLAVQVNGAGRLNIGTKNAFNLSAHTIANNGTGSGTFRIQSTGTGTDVYLIGSAGSRIVQDSATSTLWIGTETGTGTGFNGETIIKKGRLLYNSQRNDALSATRPITIGNSAGGSDDAIYQVNATTWSHSFGNPIIVAANTTGTLTLRVNDTGNRVTTFSGGITGDNSLTIDNSAGSGSSATVFGTNPLNFSGTLTHIGAGSSALTINSVIGANVTGVAQNSATSAMVLNGANTYTGPTTISAGTLQLGNGGATGSLDPGSTISVASGALFAVNQTDTVTQGTDFSSAAITGDGGFSQLGPGTTILNAANTHAGATTISAGVLQLGAGGSDGSLNINSAVSVAAGAIFAVNQDDTVTQGTDFSTAAITGAGGFTQLGSGTTILNVGNSYTGPTAVSNGTLIVNGDESAATGAITVGGAGATGTPTLGGTGTLGGDVTIATAGGGAAGTLAPGDGGIGNLILNSTALTLQSGSTASFEIDADTLTRDRVTGISTLTYGGTLKITASGTFDVGDSWVLFPSASRSDVSVFDNDGVFGTAGDGVNLPALGVGMLWQFDYNTGTLSIIADAGKPTVTITQAPGQLDPTNTSPINFTVDFSGDVTGFTDSDVDLSGSTAPGTLAAAVTGGPATYNVAVSGMTGDGDVVIAIPEDAVDAPGNVASDPGIGDDTVAYDPTAPTVTFDDGDPDDTVTSGDTLTYTVVFSEDMDATTVGPASFTNAATAGISIGAVTESLTTPGEFSVEVNTLLPGDLVLQIPVGAEVKDIAGNLVAAPTNDNDTVTVNVPANVYYVKSDGNDASNGTSWAEAFLTITKAVTTAKSAIQYGATDVTVYVGEGTFTVGAEQFLDQPIAVIGGTQPGATQASVIRAPGYTIVERRVFNLSHAGARLDTLTIQDGYVAGGYPVNPGQGSNIRMTAGLVTNCVIQNGRTRGGSLQGGGIWMNGGTVAGSVIAANQTWDDTGSGANTSRGSGVYMAGGQLLRCTVRGNYQTLSRSTAPGDHCFGGGVYVGNAAAVVENCVIRNNVSSSGGDNSSRGAGLYIADGTVRHCTLVKNTQALSGMDGGGLYKVGAAGAVVNCVVASNTTAGVANDFGGDETGVTYSMAPELTDTLNGNIGGGSAVPVFTNYAANDFLLVYPSPGIDDGTDVGVTNDINGDPRPIDGDGSGVAQPDMGAYESPEVAATFLCDFSVAPSPAKGLNSLSVDFEATVTGPGSDSIDHFSWDFGDGATTGGATASNVTHVFGPGAFTVTLTVSNSLGALTNRTIADVVQVLTNTVYVAAGAANRYPYNSWSNAASSVLDAVDAAKESITLGAADATVYVSNGTFTVAATVVLNQPISVIGQSRETSIIGATPATSHRVFSLTHGGARLEKIGIENGYTGANGAGVNMTTGTVVNCLIRNNQTRDSEGGGLYMSGGTVEWCDIQNNNVWISASGATRHGGGAYVAGGVLRNSVVSGNRGHLTGTAGNYNPRGGGLAVAGGIVESCLLRANYLGSAATYGQGGGAYLGSGTLRNCTVVENYTQRADQTGGGVYQADGTMLNTIVWDNTVVAGTVGTNYYGTGGSATYSAAPELTSGTGNRTDDPAFVDAAAGDFRLREDASPCVNAGLYGSWMDSATDLDGEQRVQQRVDMGAYETEVLPTLFIVR